MFGHLVGLLAQVVVVSSAVGSAEEAEGNVLNLQPQNNNFAA